MAPHRHHPEAVTLDLLTDLIARLDDLLRQLHRSSQEFQQALRNDHLHPDAPQEESDSNMELLLELEALRQSLTGLIDRFRTLPSSEARR